MYVWYINATKTPDPDQPDPMPDARRDQLEQILGTKRTNESRKFLLRSTTYVRIVTNLRIYIIIEDY